MDSAAFLSELYSDGDEHGLWLVLTRKHNGRMLSASYTSVEATSEDVAKWPGFGDDVYINIAPRNREILSHERGKLPDLGGVRALWADIDIQDPVHKKPGLPPDRDAAMKLIDATGAVPTFVVDSGHGLQPYWCFNELQLFETDADRDEMQKLSWRWGQWLIELGKRAGWAVDSVHDLPRMMRVPGTMNYKAEPVAVTVIREGGPHYEPADFAEYMPESINLKKHVVSKPAVLSVNIDMSAEFPEVKFAALLMCEPRFRADWESLRKDMPDQSASGYDMSMVSFASAAGWSDSELVALMKAAARKSGRAEKGKSYYAATITKARAHSEEKATLMLSVDLDPMERFSRFAGVGVKRLIKVGDEDNVKYRIELENGRNVRLGDEGILSNLPQLRTRMHSITNVFGFKDVSAREWKNHVYELESVIECQANPELGITGMAMMYIGLYLADINMGDNPVDDRADFSEKPGVVTVGKPFRADGHRWIHPSMVTAWVWIKHHERFEARIFTEVCNAMDWPQRTFQDGKLDRKYWGVPNETCPDTITSSVQRDHKPGVRNRGNGRQGEGAEGEQSARGGKRNAQSLFEEGQGAPKAAQGA